MHLPAREHVHGTRLKRARVCPCGWARSVTDPGLHAQGTLRDKRA